MEDKALVVQLCFQARCAVIAAIVAVGAILAMIILLWNRDAGGDDGHGHGETEQVEKVKPTAKAGAEGKEGGEEDHADEAALVRSLSHDGAIRHKLHDPMPQVRQAVDGVIAWLVTTD